jgi:hypothetical protein
MSVSSAHGSILFGYGSTMSNEFSGAEEAKIQTMSEGSQSASIDAIRDRISSVQDRDLSEHVAEYDGIHAQLERALTQIDGL